MLRIHLVGPRTGSVLQRAIEQAPWERAGFVVGDERAEIHLLVAETPVSSADQEDVRRQAREAGALLVLAGPSLRMVDGGELDVTGAGSSPIPPLHPMRLRTAADWPRGDVEITDTLALVPTTGSALVTANVALVDYPVISVQAPGDLVTVAVGHSPDTWANAYFLQLLHHALHQARGLPTPGDIGVGLLGFGAIGAEHAASIMDTPGLVLAAAGDTNSARLDVARSIAPGIDAFTDADDLIGASGVQAVVVSTPPNAHGMWARRALAAGRHVVIEKPMALSAAECDVVLSEASASGLTAVVYQNRRFDPDFLQLQHLATSGSLGELFHVEAFIGGYGHPCNYWHSERSVSGGALFDWGSHVIDQLLQLMPGDIEYVTAVNHKRVWHDVTNADHARVTLMLEGGREATFVYSDLAAALKPRWYALGTRGAVVGDWRYETVVTRNAIGTLDEDVLAPADAPPVMRFVDADGSTTTLGPPRSDAHPFHADLSLWLRYGIPMRVSGAQSRRVVSVLEAAEESASLGGVPVKPA